MFVRDRVIAVAVGEMARGDGAAVRSSLVGVFALMASLPFDNLAPLLLPPASVLGRSRGGGPGVEVVVVEPVLERGGSPPLIFQLGVAGLAALVDARLAQELAGVVGAQLGVLKVAGSGGAAFLGTSVSSLGAVSVRVLHQGVAVWLLALVFGAVVVATRDSTVTALDVARVVATVSMEDGGFLEAA